MEEKQLLVELDDYLKAGIHIGTKLRTKFMSKFIYKVRSDGLSVLNVEQINDRIKNAINLLSQFDPKGPANGSRRVQRGGTWSYQGIDLRSARRGDYPPDRRYDVIGFRLALRQVSLPPTDLNSTAPLTIAENQPVGSIVGDFNASDPDANATLTYSLISGVGDSHNSLFTLNHLNLDTTPSLLVWLDGNDSSSIRKDGSGFVDLWEDKSGKNNNFEDYNSGGRPIANSSGGVTFANGKWLVTQPWTGSTPPEFAGNPAFTVILAAKGDSSGKRMVVIANPGPNRIHMEEDGAITIQDSNGVWKNTSGSYNFSSPSVGAWRRAKWAGYDQSEFFLNGVSKTITFSGDPDSSDLVVNPSNSYLALGHNSIGFAGEIYEVFIFAERLQDEKIRMLEGYLAHKWNTSSLLTSEHAYKENVPTLTPTLKAATTFDYESNASSYSIRVQVKDEYNATSEGNFTVTLTDANDWVNGTVTLSGTAQVGQTLTVSNNLTDQDGMGTISYLWQREGKPSHGGYVKDGENGVDGLNSANRMTISPDGKHIYITAINDRAITWHERNATTGAVTFLGYVKDGENGVDGLRGARDVAISPDGNDVYAVAAADDGISWYDRNVTTGALTFRSFLKDNQNGMDGLNGAQALVISPDGKNIYIAGREEDAVTWVDRNTTTGEITFNGFLKNGTNGVSGLNFPVSIDISSDGKHIYLVGRDDNAVSWFDRNTTNGDLSFSGYVQNGSNGINNLLSPENLLLTSSGDFLYVSSPEANATLCFSRDSSTGNLTYISSITDGINGVSGIKGAYYLSLSPNEENLYVSAKTDYSIAWFDRNTTSGSLNYGGKLAYDTADYIPTKDPTGAQVSADGKYFYQLGGSS
ncbi:MAG: beta-propeller fold lactonase family protein, partial [Opitutae bacterium]|nr:beta-propeller fold lactonase family protein [Opitutae bacterium]